MSRRSGFTLIELLVVIAIIAILAAILFPVFARARAKAQQSTCLSNVKQIQLGFMMYESDNNGGFPSPCNGGPGGASEVQWDVSVMPYLKNYQILIDPSAASTPTMQDGATKSNYIGQWEAGGPDGSPPDPPRLDNVGYPAEMFDLMCSNQQPGWTGMTSGYTNYLAVGGYGNYQEIMFLHNQGVNVGFVDGHAAWMSQAVVLAKPRPWGQANDIGTGCSARFWFGNDIQTWPNWVNS